MIIIKKPTGQGFVPIEGGVPLIPVNDPNSPQPYDNGPPVIAGKRTNDVVDTSQAEKSIQAATTAASQAQQNKKLLVVGGLGLMAFVFLKKMKG